MTGGWIPPDFMLQFLAAAFTSIWTKTLFHISNPPFWLNVRIVSSSNDLELIIMSICVSSSICLQPWKLRWLRTTHCLFTELWDLISSPSFPRFYPSLISLLSLCSLHPFISLHVAFPCSIFSLLFLPVSFGCGLVFQSDKKFKAPWWEKTERSCEATIKSSVRQITAGLLRLGRKIPK